ncbi:MAG: DUF58 domain-containing protein [Pirellulaceae bacterium]|jgi:uncharacterized protein (DUF58 family)|nr:DUF58 domain-containing protein [Pirellulaceae bacterium]
MTLEGNQGGQRLLRPDSLGNLSRLEFIARGVVEGFITGRHQSPYKGTSIEFAEHRQYVSGDDLRNLDWRVFGKSDRYYIKQYKEETNLRSTILLDASGSMNYVGERAAKIDGQMVSKFEYSKYLAAALSYLLVNQQDAVGLVSFDTEIRDYIPARSNARHLRVLLNTIDELQTGAETELAGIFDDIAERVHRRGLVVVISDLFGDPTSLIKSLYHFRYRRHEVVLMHVMADEELTFPFDKWSDFRDLENPGSHEELDPVTLRAEYLDRVRGFISQIEVACGQMEIDYVPMNTRVPFEVALSGFLASRRNGQK